MDQKIIDFNKSQKTKQTPELRTGDVVRIHKKIKEGEKERIQIFEGIVIAIKGKQSASPMITVRRDSKGFGVEITIPIFSPLVEKIEVLRHSKVRQSKLYYMRNRFGKSAKMQVKDLSEEEKNQAEELEKQTEIAETEVVEEKEAIKNDSTKKEASSEKTKKEKDAK